MKKSLIMGLLALALLVTFAAAALAQETLKMGDTGDAVMELNTRLRQLNYSDQPGRSTYSEATVAAVKAVQKAYGLPETGEADPETLAIIYGECYRPLGANARGEEVRLLQEKLKELGYYSGNITANYQEGTVAAVKDFQKACGMEASGVADVKTQEKLYALAVRPTPTPSPVPSPTPVRTASPTPGPYQAFSKTLKKGSSSKTVQQVQQRLMDLGFFTFYKTTEYYGDNTVDAVKAFQRKNGIKVTGNVDADTWDALFNDADVRGVGDEARAATPVPYTFEVDVNNQAVKIWKYNEAAGGYTDLDQAFICTTGTKKNPSPQGTFTLNGRRARFCTFPTWGGNEARWWVQITPEIAFHSVIFTDASRPETLVKSSYTNLGKRGSHGCIRLTLEDAKWMYDHAREGMKVRIHEDAADDPELKYFVRYRKEKPEINLASMLAAYPAYDGHAAPETVERILKKGDSGADVYWLQMKLKELGFYKGTVTGQFQDGTTNAVKQYQRAKGLTQSGKADTKTLTTLYSEASQPQTTVKPQN